MKRSAFTLLELLLTVVIAGTLVTLVTSLSFSIMRAQSRQKVAAEVEQQASFTLRTIMDDIQNADSLNAPLNSSAAALSLNMPGTIDDPLVIDLDAGRIRRTAAAASSYLTSAELVISNLQFTDRAAVGKPGSVQVSFSVSYNGGGRDEFTYNQSLTGSATIKR